MTRAEIYKLRTHRTPWVCAAALLVGVLMPSIALIWYTPADTAAYSSAYLDTYDVLSVLLGIIFGGWLLGTEYRQGTLKRLLAGEPRRMRVLAVKGAVGAAALSAVLAVAAVVGWAAARLVGSAHDVTVAWQGRSLLAAALTGLVAATIAYSFSAITRSDSFAMVGALALALVLEPLLSLVPTVGKYTLGTALDHMYQSVSGAQVLPATEHSTAGAALLLVAWVSTFVGVAAAAFARRDV